MKIVGATDLVGLWALEWAWHIRFRGLWAFSGRGTLLKQTCALEAQESVRQISIAKAQESSCQISIA